MFLFQNIRFNN